MTHPAPEKIVLVGPGRAGTALVRIWQRLGHVVLAISGGSAESQAAARTILGPLPARHPADVGDSATLIVVAPPDDRLDSVVAELAQAARAPQDPAPIVIHLAGSRGRDALAPLFSRGFRGAAFHPLRSFPARDPGPTDLAGCACAIESAAADRERLFRLARDGGGVPFELGAAGRDLYHAGAAAAGNAVLAVLDLGERALVKAGVPPSLARSALVALAQGALGNAARTGVSAALSGPVVRGDLSVVARHLAALETLGASDRDLYRELCRALMTIAARRDDGHRAALLAPLFDPPPGENRP